MEDGGVNLLTCHRCCLSFESIDQFVVPLNSHGMMTQAACQSLKASYTCHSCGAQFDSTCTMHNHMLNCSYDGSYIFDNTKRMAIPLTAHLDGQSANDKAGTSVDAVQELIQTIVDSRSEKLVAVCNGLKTFLTLLKDVKLPACDQPKTAPNSDIEQKNNVLKIKSTNKCKTRKCRVQTLKRKSRKTHVTRKKAMYMNAESNTNRPVAQQEDLSLTTNEMTGNNIQGLEFSAKEVENDMTVKANKSQPKETKEIDNNDKYSAIEDIGVRNLKHSRLNKKYNSLKNKDSISSSMLKRSRRNYEQQVCNVCEKVMPVCRLKTHMAVHTDERPFKCDQCGKNYKYKKHLTAHHQQNHNKITAFFCDQCGSGFATKGFLKNHMMSQHTEAHDRPWKCDICGTGFVNQFRLNRHRIQHTGNKPLQCDLCGMRFTQQYNLQQHVVSKHREERRFACTQCEKKFVTNYQLKCHILKHSGVRPFACKMCTKTFIEKKELRRHMRNIHSMTMDEESLPDLTQVFEALQGTDPTLHSTPDTSHMTQDFSGGHLPVVETLDSSTSVHNQPVINTGVYTQPHFAEYISI